MRIPWVLLIVLVVACGHPSTPRARTIATLTEDGITPFSLTISGNRIYVLTSTADLGVMRLFAVDSASGQTQVLSPTLPNGALALDGDKLVYGEFFGAVGTIDPTSGAYSQTHKLDQSIASVIATKWGVFVGGDDKVFSIDASGVHTVPGFDIGPYHNVDQLAASASAVYATGTLATSVVRIQDGHTSAIADKQTDPMDLTVAGDDILWTTGEGSDPGKKLVGVPASGGPVAVLAQADAGALIWNIAADGNTVVCSMTSDKQGGIYLITKGTAPRLLVAAHAAHMAVAGGSVYWIEETPGGWALKTLAVASK